MKRRFYSLLLILLAYAPAVPAQVADTFPAEFTALVASKPEHIRGSVTDKQSSATSYEVKLKLSGFKLRYVESTLGNSLGGNFDSQGSQEIMDGIRERLLETKYVAQDSKTQKNVLSKGLFDSDLARKINVLDFAAGGEKVAVFSLTKDNKISVEFLHK